MTFSVNTNVGAMVALQNLNSTQSQLMTTENRINTGLKVSSAKDNAAVWAIAQGQRADVGSLGAVKSSLDRATSIADVASAAGSTISDLLVQMKANVVAASHSLRISRRCRRYIIDWFGHGIESQVLVEEQECRKCLGYLFRARQMSTC